MELLIFDLDGTLVDSRADLVHSVNATRNHMGFAPLDDDLVASYVGNGAPVLIRRAMGDGASETQVQTALEFFMEYYASHDLECTTLYPEVRESLERFRDAGKRMAVLTNKPVIMTRHILEGLGVSGFFFQVFGGNSFEQKKPDPIGVETLLREAGVERSEAMMIGDSSVDVQTARNAGIVCCGVTYGFQPASLADPAPEILVDRMGQLADRLLRK